MTLKILIAVLTVVVGIGAAVLLYWLLNKLVELLPGPLEGRIKPYVYILPAYVAISFYLIYPGILTIIDSFKDSTSEKWVGLDNFTRLLGSHDFQQTLINTLLWIIIVPTLTVAIGLGIAQLTDKLSPSGEKLAKTIIFMPMAISFVGAGTIWRLMYAYSSSGPQIGLLNAIATKLGHSPVAWLSLSHFHVNSLLLMVMLLWAQAGYSMVLLSSAIKGVPEETLEAAAIDGAGGFQIFFQVVVPQIMGTIVTVFVTVLITVMKIFDIVYVMTRGSFNTNVVGNEFYNQLFNFFDYGAASAIVVILIIAVIPVMWFQVRHFKREEAA
ncbi:MAG: sugar ABC transporter permease [Nocardioidaceae bacterium]